MPVDSPEDLYGLPLPRFIPEREALVKALRSEKRRDAAAAAAKTRKPSVAAWAVNQLVRTQSKTIRALFEAGDDLARAQGGAAAGKRTANALREATRRQRDALDDLLQAAKGLLSSDGHPLTAPTLERVADTLRAASINGASRQQVADGCLPHELRFAGMGIGDLAALHPESPPAPATEPRQTTSQAPKKRSVPKGGKAKAGDVGGGGAGAERKGEAQRRAEAARDAEAARKRKAALTAARKTEAKARRAATRAEKELTAAQARRAEAAASLEEAEQLLATAAKRAEETAAELKEAERSLSDPKDD